MYQKKKTIQNLILVLADIIAVISSYFLANLFWMGAIKKYNVFKRGETLDQLGLVLGAFVIVTFCFNTNSKFIKRKIYEEFIFCINMNFLFAAAYAIALFFGNSFDEASRGVFIFTAVFNIFLMFFFRMLVRIYLIKIYKNRKKNDQLFVITTSDRINDVMEAMRRNFEWSNRVSGIAILDKDMVGQIFHKVEVVATKASVVDYIRTQVIDEVYVDVSLADDNSVFSLIMEMENMGTTVNLSMEYLESFKDFNKSLTILGDKPVITFAEHFVDPNKLVIKRLIDIIGAIVGIIITLIVSIFLAPAILLESRGPLVFKQKRVGKNGRYFYVYKFRSMYKDAEERKKALMEQNEMKGLMFKMTDDPRITKVGKFIRKTSLDELPQFFNVLKGDMSLVGTRPPTVDEFKQYEGYHKRRLSMKPGMTGMWQVSGRSDIEDFEEVVKLDLQYIDNWSVGLDIKILFKTVGVVFHHGGAR